MPKTIFSGFVWDDGNRQKCQKHGVPISEIEYVLAHAETLVMPDPKNTQAEARFLAIGRTEKGRYTFVVSRLGEAGARTSAANKRALYAPKGDQEI